jgi:hypothetical protein
MSSNSEELAYEQGYRAAVGTFLSRSLRESSAAVRDKNSWVSERMDAVAMLRQVCAEWGDNDWPDGLHLGDIIEKHLWRHLKD